MNKQLLLPALFLLGILLIGCSKNRDYQDLPAAVAGGYQMVVEIPAGTNHKIEYRKDDRRFAVDRIDGEERVIDFLPYPGNYGFIPSTFMDPARGGDGDALDVLVIGESRPTGSVVAIRPIGVLQMRDRGEIDSKLIAIPLDSSQQVIDPRNFQDFLLRYDAAKRIIEEWFLHYKGMGVMELIRWEDDKYAVQEIEKWKER